MVRVVLSNLSNNDIAGKSVRRWIYLGTSVEASARLSKILSSQGRVDYAKDLYDLSEQCRGDLTAWIDDLSLSGPAQKEWYFSVPATKNPYSSRLFLNVCYFFIAQTMLSRYEDLDLIVVDSPALARTLQKNFKTIKASSMNFLGRGLTAVQGFIKSAGRFVLFATRAGHARAAAKKVLGDRAQNILKEPVERILIRNYISKDFSAANGGMFEHHFFPNLSSYLQDHGKKPIFLPIGVHIDSYEDLFAKVKASGRDIIFAEEFLTISDYAYALYAPVRCLFYRVPPIAFKGHDLRALVVEDYRDNVTEPSFLNAFLLSRLGRRLKSVGLNLETIINWSEFQSFEKGLIAGLREAYPQAKLIGSQPFCPPENHLSLIPSRQDKIFKILPDKFLVLGPLTQTMFKQRLPDLKVDFTPAFRYQSVFDFQLAQPDARDLIVLFGYGLANALFVLRTLIELIDRMPPFRKILIKLHPATYFKKERLIREVGASIPPNVEFVDGKLEDYADGVMIGICGGTGTAVELVARGIPSIVVAEQRALTMHYLPGREHPDLWRVCFSPDEIIQAVTYFYEHKKAVPQKLQQSALEFRKAYFAEPDERNWENYLSAEVKSYHYVA